MTVEPSFKEHATLNGNSRSVTSLRFSPDGKTLVSAGESESLDCSCDYDPFLVPSEPLHPSSPPTPSSLHGDSFDYSLTQVLPSCSPSWLLAGFLLRHLPSLTQVGNGS